MTNQIAVQEDVKPEQRQPSAQDTTAVAQHFIKSGYFKDVTDVSKAVVKILAGQEIGIGPFAAMSGINVIQGRITLSANLIAAQIKRSGKYNFHIKEHSDTICVLEFFEAGKSVGESAFSMTDAQKAGLAAGVNWKNYPRNMLFARAISNGAKWFCPDVFGGSPVYTPDELGSPVDPQTGEILPLVDDGDGPPQPPASTPSPPKATAPAGWPASALSYETRLQAFLAKAQADLGMDFVAVNTIAAREGADLSHVSTDLRVLWETLKAEAKVKA